ncbi:MAG: hypothetical protein LUE87_07280 [Lachnospiraceae bacterium]|nr:hypothetical protein [Lachnospiraceae bacterium]
MREKIRPRCLVFLRGFLGLFLITQFVLGTGYWLGNVTRAQQFDTISAIGRWIGGLSVLPVHIMQTVAVFGGLYCLFGCFYGGWRRLFASYAALTIPFVMQICLSETEHGAALAAILCMTGVIMDCHRHCRGPLRAQAVLCGVCVGILILCGAAYSCAAALLFLTLSIVRIIFSEKKEETDISKQREETDISEQKEETGISEQREETDISEQKEEADISEKRSASVIFRKKKITGAISLLAALLIGAGLAFTGITVQNKLNPDRMQVSWESFLLRRFAYPGLDWNLLEGLPQEVQNIYTASEINNFRLHPYELDTVLESDLLETVGEERTRKIYLELAWYGFLCGTKVDARMILEDIVCYLSPLLMYPFYSDGTILAEFGWSLQQFLAGTPYLAETYMYACLSGYAVGLVLTLAYWLSGGFFCIRVTFRRYRPLLLLWVGLSVLFMMRGAAVFNYKYAAFQAVLGYLPLLMVHLNDTRGQRP